MKTDTRVSDEELVRLREKCVEANDEYVKAAQAASHAWEAVLKALAEYEAAGGTKELFRRSVEKEEKTQ